MSAVDIDTMLTAALDAHDAGICVVRVATNGSKKPVGTWKRYQTRRPDRPTVERWFKDDHPGVGYIVGAVSGNVEMIEFEGRFRSDDNMVILRDRIHAAGIGSLFNTLLSGYSVWSPSNGLHMFVRLADGPVPGNSKIARRPATPDELADDPDNPIQTLIETRGEGGFVVAAPSHGPVHPTGNPWTVRSGSATTIPTITLEQRDALLAVLATFHEPIPKPKPPPPNSTRRTTPKRYSGGTIGDSWFDAVVEHVNATEDIRQLLERHGWVHQYDDKHGRQLMCRPGKTDAVSGSITNGRFVNFSSSAPFDPYNGTNRPTSYDALDVIAMYEHGDDRKAAARHIADDTGIMAQWQTEQDAKPDPRTFEPNIDLVTGKILTPEVINPNRFFSSKNGLRHATLRAAAIERGPIATGIGRTLWHYHNGVWLPGGDDEIRRRCRHLLGQRWRKSHVEGLVADLAADYPFIVDAAPTRWINTPTGMLDWRTGQLEPHRPDIPTTYQLDIGWNPTATCPTVDRWLADVAPDDAIELIWEIIGTAIYADQPFHRAVLLVGPGRNGKGTLLRLIRRLIGDRHVSAVTLQSLGEDRFAAASLFGKVANIAGDLDARSIGRTDIFKMATGGDAISAAHKYGSTFTFTNRATMLFSANELPGSSDHTDGFFSRWVVVPFTRLQLTPGQEDHTIEHRLHAELEGVLVKAVEGLRRAMDQGGYTTPASVIDATADYRETADPLRRFIDDCLDVTDDYNDTVSRSGVYTRYKEWNDENGHRPFGANRFWGRLVAVDPRIDPTRIAAGMRLVGGVRLVDSWK